ncbi:hypothetical protein I317_03342 [Kwoniella heveanensis CBS 569]|nr:hypothetical protein I317_03342 [Kwoniella heveanensis CBS 569]
MQYVYNRPGLTSTAPPSFRQTYSFRRPTVNQPSTQTYNPTDTTFYNPSSYYQQQQQRHCQPQPQPQQDRTAPTGQHVMIGGQLYYVEDDSWDSEETPPGWQPTYPYPYGSSPGGYGYGYGASQFADNRQWSYRTQPQSQLQSPYAQQAPSYYTQPFQQTPSSYLSPQIQAYSQQQQQSQYPYGTTPIHQQQQQSNLTPLLERTFTLEEYAERDRLERYYRGQSLEGNWWEKPAYWKTLDRDSGAQIVLIPSKPEIPVPVPAPVAVNTGDVTVGTGTGAPTVPGTATNTSTSSPAGAQQAATPGAATTPAGTETVNNSKSEPESNSIWSSPAPPQARQWSRHHLWEPCATLGDMVDQYLSHKMDKALSQYERRAETYEALRQRKEELRTQEDVLVSEIYGPLSGTMRIPPQSPQAFVTRLKDTTVLLCASMKATRELDTKCEDEFNSMRGAQEEALKVSQLMSALKEDSLTEHELLDAWERLGIAVRETAKDTSGASHREASHLDIHIHNVTKQQASRSTATAASSEGTGFRSSRTRSQTPGPNGRRPAPTPTATAAAATGTSGCVESRDDDDHIFFA